MERFTNSGKSTFTELSWKTIFGTSNIFCSVKNILGLYLKLPSIHSKIFLFGCLHTGYLFILDRMFIKKLFVLV